MTYNRVGCAAKIMQLSSAYQQWMCAKSIKVDNKWGAMRVDVMKKIIRAKYEQCKEYRDKLHSCKGLIVEAVCSDRFWAAGITASQVMVNNGQMPGENVMGKLHMTLRDEKLQEEGKHLIHIIT